MRRVREEIERQQEEEYVRKETDQGMCLFAGAATTLYVSYLREKQHWLPVPFYPSLCMVV